jgi:hypothetical protein
MHIISYAYAYAVGLTSQTRIQDQDRDKGHHRESRVLPEGEINFIVVVGDPH